MVPTSLTVTRASPDSTCVAAQRLRVAINAVSKLGNVPSVRGACMVFIRKVANRTCKLYTFSVYLTTTVYKVPRGKWAETGAH